MPNTNIQIRKYAYSNGNLTIIETEKTLQKCGHISNYKFQKVYAASLY